MAYGSQESGRHSINACAFMINLKLFGKRKLNDDGLERLSETVD